MNIPPIRYSLAIALALALSLAVAGCGGKGSGGGGGGGGRTASVSGTVTDVNGDPVRGARVWTRDGQTTTTTTGAYILRNQRNDNLDVHAEIVQNGVRYKGQNVGVTVQGLPTESVNIVVAPINQLASIRGVVQDRDGARLSNASVFAYADTLSSQRTVTGPNGEYELFGLISGLDYTVSAGGRLYRSDVEFITLRDGERRTLNFVLSDPGNPLMPTPQDLDAICWTSPRVATRSTEQRNAIENLKRLFDPKRLERKATQRTTARGNLVEVNLDWIPVDGLDLLGYGIYRARGGAGAFTAVDFLREPLAGYYVDLDDTLRPDTLYRYAVTSLSVIYPSDPERSESDLSNEAVVIPLDDLLGITTVRNPFGFAWDGGSGAEEYVVYVFDQFPGIGVQSIWNNANSPVIGTSLEYAGPALLRGRRYYYMVLGLADDRTSRTISTVGEFVAE